MTTASPLPPHLAPSTPCQQSTPRPPRSRPSPGPSPAQSNGRSSSFGSPRSNSPRTSAHGTVDIDAIIKSHGGDVRRALEATVMDRNGLQAQNSQLWKLIEKQRGQCASLAADNERLRSDRERANSKLSEAGLEPIPLKKIANSASVVGLGLRPEAPPIRRHNSDRDEKPRSTLQVPFPEPSRTAIPLDDTPPTRSSSLGVEQTISDSTPPALLPSPLVVQDAKLRRESRMAFPPEVSTFMSLADSPRELHHQISPQIPVSASCQSINSPASQYSESAGEAGPSIPPPSSRALAITTDTVHEEPEEEDTEEMRAPSTLTDPPPRKESLTPELPSRETFNASQSQDSVPQSQDPRPSEDPDGPLQDHDTPRQSTDTRPSTERQPSHQGNIRMTPSLLSHTRLSIVNSTIHPNALGRDVLCFIVSITVRPPNAQPVSWNVVKLFSAFIDLDTKVKAKAGKGRKEWKTMIAPLPDGKAWKDFAPSKIDQRKRALEAYIQSLLVAPLSDKSDLCDFLNTDRVQARQNGARKEGYLTKKGKNFGGWKTRYFMIDGPVMEYYESRGGTHLGSIVISGAQIGRQNRPSESSDEKDYRHAFLIIEQVKKGGLRHVLCAESDMERDSWIEVLCKHVDPDAPVNAPETPVTKTSPQVPQITTPGVTRRRSNSRKSSRDVVVTAAQPMSSVTSGSKFGGAPSPSLINKMESKRATQQIQPTAFESSSSSQANSQGRQSSNPTTVVTSSPSDAPPSSSSPVETTPRPSKRQSATPNRPSHSAAYLSKVATEGLTIPGMTPRDKERDRKAKSGRFWPSFGKGPEKVSRPVFGVPLADSIAIASKANLPAIVFRCIEWLEAKHAEREEGIYRLSGSSAVIKGLKDRFDAEGDVDLLQVDENWDPHAIGGLLKTFLRDLPHSLLTRDLHPRFLAVMDLIDSSARVAELSRLVSELPPPNYALLRALTAHLILIVRNSTTNKMTLRNIGIVFSPTLGIPAGIFSELVSSFKAIFDDDPPASIDTSRRHDNLDSLAEEDEDTEETVRRKRNSMLYQAGGADVLLGLGGRSLDPAVEDSASEAETDDLEVESESRSLASEDTHSNGNPTTPRAEAYPSAAAARKAKAAARASDRGLMLTVDSPSKSDNGHVPSKRDDEGVNGGLPASPRPNVESQDGQ